MRTIIQHIGPLYGEANTGSVFGQPNGSIAIGQGKAPAPSPEPTPITPTETQIWTISYPGNEKYPAENNTYIYQLNRAIGNYLVVSQSTRNQNFPICSIQLDQSISDSTSYMQLQLSDSDSFDNILWSYNASSGTFTTIPDSFQIDSSQTYGIVTGQKYYVRLRLFDSSGNYLNMYSNTLEYTGKVEN